MVAACITKHATQPEIGQRNLHIRQLQIAIAHGSDNVHRKHVIGVGADNDVAFKCVLLHCNRIHLSSQPETECLFLKGNNMNTITVEMRSNYGNVAYYPVCDKAKALAAIANTKTLTAHALKQCKALGFTVLITVDIPTIS